MSPDSEFTLLSALATASQHMRMAEYTAAVDVLERVVRSGASDDGSATLRRVYIKLATAYRILERYGDEVALLAHYIAGHPDDFQRARMQGRMYKAETLLHAALKSSDIPVSSHPISPRRTGLHQRLVDRQLRAKRSMAREQQNENALELKTDKNA